MVVVHPLAIVGRLGFLFGEASLTFHIGAAQFVGCRGEQHTFQGRVAAPTAFHESVLEWQLRDIAPHEVRFATWPLIHHENAALRRRFLLLRHVAHSGERCVA